MLLHVLHGAHNVVGGLEELEDAVVELSLLASGELVGGVSLLEGLGAADVEHGGHHLSVGLLADLFHIRVHS